MKWGFKQQAKDQILLLHGENDFIFQIFIVEENYLRKKDKLLNRDMAKRLVLYKKAYKMKSMRTLI